jgi:hypothetical protein
MGTLLAVRKLADRSGVRVKRWDPVTGNAVLLTPETAAAYDAQLPGFPAGEPWPLAGVELTGAPEVCSTGVGWVTEGIREGWIVGENERVVHRPGGPADDPWRVTHTFRHFDALIIADVRYRVTHQPDKYADPGDDITPVTSEVYADGATRVDHFYGLAKE